MPFDAAFTARFRSSILSADALARELFSSAPSGDVPAESGNVKEHRTMRPGGHSGSQKKQRSSSQCPACRGKHRAHTCGKKLRRGVPLFDPGRATAREAQQEALDQQREESVQPQARKRHSPQVSH